MKHRIRGACLVVRDEKLLLVRHLEGPTLADYWIPPGGGLEIDDASIFACAERETKEETGLEVSGRSILYLQEFVDHAFGYRNMEFFILADATGGEVQAVEVRTSSTGVPIVSEVGWFSRESMNAMTVFPDCLKDSFWDERKVAPFTTRHLGTKVRQKAAN